MKRTFSLILLLTTFMLVFIGCKATSVNPPVAVTASSGGAAGVPATVQVTLGAASIGNGSTTSVTATVMDGSGAAVAKAAVSFRVISASTGSISPASAFTNASGVATATFTATASNTTATIRASVTSGTTAVNGTAPITIGVPVPVPTNIVVSLGTVTAITNGSTTAVSATVTGASGAISGATVTFTVNPPGSGTFAQSAVTTVGGIAATTFTGVIERYGRYDHRYGGNIEQQRAVDHRFSCPSDAGHHDA